MKSVFDHIVVQQADAYRTVATARQTETVALSLFFFNLVPRAFPLAREKALRTKFSAVIPNYSLLAQIP